MSLYKWSLNTISRETPFEVARDKSVESEKYCKTEDKKDGEQTKTRVRRSTAVRADTEDFS